MEAVNKLFLQAVKASLVGKTLDWGNEVTADQYAQMLELAQNHHVLPMFYEATYRCSAALGIEPQRLSACRRTVLQSVSMQSLQTDSFLKLNRALRERGIDLLVVKGIVCRSLYPMPDHRYSGDEDLLCPPDQVDACHQALLELGLVPCHDRLDAYEVPYRRDDGTLYIELHKQLFPGDSPVFEDYNPFFQDVFQKAERMHIGDEEVLTLPCTQHLLFLILHAFKHFLHSGFGIRQVCDIVLYANAWGKDVDWDYLTEKCTATRSIKFAAALFAIGKHYLCFDPKAACYPDTWRQIRVDETALLEDLLRGGIYGASDANRLHSSNMTLSAAAADKQGKRSGGVMQTVFPSAKALENRYPYLQSKPFLLPAAWIQRLAGYAKENAQGNGNVKKALDNGKNRIKLLKKYDIID